MKLSDIIKTNIKVYAHTPNKESREKETLQEHTDRCDKYYKKLMNKPFVNETFVLLEKVLLNDDLQEYMDLFKELMNGVIILHDVGKISPMFQKEIMKNDNYPEMKGIKYKSTNHSPLSAYIYLDYSINLVDTLKKEKSISQDMMCSLYELVLINCYLVMKHHSELHKFEKIFQELIEGGRLYGIGNDIKNGFYKKVYKGNFLKQNRNYKLILDKVKNNEERYFAKYIYSKLMYSLLVACDYYATNEYTTGYEMNDFGDISEIDKLCEWFESTQRVQDIRKFQLNETRDDGNLNFLRNKLFCETEYNLLKNINNDIFFLEAPTGSGKSNIAYNLSFKLAKQGCNKIIYVYPFNNLVEQNKASIEEIFEGKNILSKITVLNSITPIKCEPVENNDTDNQNYEDKTLSSYSKALLDRQFWNYPIILTTHVSLFQNIFGIEKESVFGFHQLAGSVIVLDEIQSYKNTIWTEIMMTLQYLCKYLHCKVIIMSATLPDLTLLTNKVDGVCRLVNDRDYYFKDNRFKNRVKISYDLLYNGFSEDLLMKHVKEQCKLKKKILIEFINKKMAYRFFEKLSQENEMGIPIDLMTGDDNCIDREKILKNAKNNEYCQNGYVLVATQVVEAGIDIDMDIGYKDISILDSEEQFMGRLNRNFKPDGDGIVYFFNLYNASQIYKNEYRINKEFTLLNQEMQSVLSEKEFGKYYSRVLEVLKKLLNESSNAEGIKSFTENEIGKLAYKSVSDRMKLIEDDEWSISVFMSRDINKSDGEIIHGVDVWSDYKKLLYGPKENYAKFMLEISQLNSKLNLFIYKIKKNSNITFNDKIGEIYYIENGDEFFENGKLNREKLEQAGGLFIDI